MKPNFLGMVNDLFASEELPDRATIERAEMEALRAARLEYTRAAIPSDDFDAIVQGTLKTTRALRSAMFWHEHVRGVRVSRDRRPMRFLALLGPTSLGKTVAACWVIAEMGGLYVSAPDLSRRAASRNWGERSKIEALHLARLVVVDDLGTEAASEEMQSAMFDLVNARQAKGMATVFTGNMTGVEFGERYGERVLRRVQHQGVIVHVDGADLRREAL